MTAADVKPGMRVRVSLASACYEGTVLGIPYGSGPWVTLTDVTDSRPMRWASTRVVLLRCISPV